MVIRRDASLIRSLGLGIPALALIAAAGCGDDGKADEPDGGGDVEPDATSQVMETTFGKTFEPYAIGAGDEIETCLQWTLDNEQALYVNAVEMINEGIFHHSNWYIVPDDLFGEQGGEDGYFNCEDRGWSQDLAPLVGTVLFIQSTESDRERSQFPEGVVSKIPPNHMIVVDVHFLNATPREAETRARLNLDLIHPSLVETVVSPFRLAYEDLEIPPESISRHFTECEFADNELLPSNENGEFEDLELYYLVPHYHSLGIYADLTTVGGSRDGETIFEHSGYNADGMGEVYNPPADLSGATGLGFSCGFDNPRTESVGYGIGDQEMCVFVGFTNAEAQFQLLVDNPGTIDETVDEDGTVWHEGQCEVIVAERPDSQSPPEQAEIDGDLYVPDSGNPPDGLEDLCTDTPDGAVATDEVTLTNIAQNIFEPSCSFSACHGGDSPPAGLALTAEALHDELINHEVQGDTDLPLIDPGNAEGSWLYHLISNCEPDNANKMPKSSQKLLPDDLVALVRDWIDAGAEDN